MLQDVAGQRGLRDAALCVLLQRVRSLSDLRWINLTVAKCYGARRNT